MQTQKHRHTDTDTDTDTDTHAQRHRHRHACTETQAQTRMHRDTDTDTKSLFRDARARAKARVGTSEWTTTAIMSYDRSTCRMSTRLTPRAECRMRRSPPLTLVLTQWPRSRRSKSGLAQTRVYTRRRHVGGCNV
eukprot:6214213-Pleurochrysis_carterae.AAC.1